MAVNRRRKGTAHLKTKRLRAYKLTRKQRPQPEPVQAKPSLWKLLLCKDGSSRETRPMERNAANHEARRLLADGYEVWFFADRRDGSGWHFVKRVRPGEDVA